MGGVISALYGAAKTVRTSLGVLRSLSADYNAFLSRANSPPGLPVESPTDPYWLEDPPFPELVDVQSPAFPEEADIVIIGSGITGAAVARTILHECRRKGESGTRVVVLEARQICSGATGRNGGHIKACPYELFGRLRKKMSPDRAAELVRFQLRHLRTLVGMCIAEKIDVAECREVETVDFFVDASLYEESVEEVKLLREWVPEFEVTTWTASEAQKVYCVPLYSAPGLKMHLGVLRQQSGRRGNIV